MWSFIVLHSFNSKDIWSTYHVLDTMLWVKNIKRNKIYEKGEAKVWEGMTNMPGEMKTCFIKDIWLRSRRWTSDNKRIEFRRPDGTLARRNGQQSVRLECLAGDLLEGNAEARLRWALKVLLGCMAYFVGRFKQVYYNQIFKHFMYSGLLRKYLIQFNE